MKMMFPNEEELIIKGEMINDISGIVNVHDLSNNIDDSSFVMHLDSSNNRIGGNTNRAVRQQNFQNTCKCNLIFFKLLSKFC